LRPCLAAFAGAAETKTQVGQRQAADGLVSKSGSGRIRAARAGVEASKRWTICRLLWVARARAFYSPKQLLRLVRLGLLTCLQLPAEKKEV